MSTRSSLVARALVVAVAAVVGAVTTMVWRKETAGGRRRPSKGETYAGAESGRDNDDEAMPGLREVCLPVAGSIQVVAKQDAASWLLRLTRVPEGNRLRLRAGVAGRALRLAAHCGLAAR